MAGLPPALAARSIPITMFRAARGSEKPRRRLDAQPRRWQAIRDTLHVLALEHGPTWLELPNRLDVCPSGIDGRDHEIWQPLPAIASWFEQHGCGGLVGLLEEHALSIIDTAADDQVSDTDEILLHILAEKRVNLEMPQPRDILLTAQELEPALFRHWSAKGVSNGLRRYGLTTSLLHGRRVFRTGLTDLARIQATYGLVLGIDENTRVEGSE